MSRLNWERSNKETLMRRRGVEWVGSDGFAGPPAPELPSPKKRNKVAPRMPGCTCDKPVGWRLDHRKTCALMRGRFAANQKPVQSEAALATQAPAPFNPSKMSLADFARAIRRSRISQRWKPFLQQQLRQMSKSQNHESDLANAVRSLLALL